MDLTNLRRALTQELVRRADDLGLDGDRLDVSYVLNWGGFVNASFHVSDGTSRFHVKLAADPEGATKLSSGMLADRLSLHYRAPRVVDGVTPERRRLCRRIRGAGARQRGESRKRADPPRRVRCLCSAIHAAGRALAGCGKRKLGDRNTLWAMFHAGECRQATTKRFGCGLFGLSGLG
jgi:hypothetical protein